MATPQKESITGKQKNSRMACAVLLVFLLFWLLNHWMPWYFGDDLMYRFYWHEGMTLMDILPFDAPKLVSFSDVLESVRNHYFSWHGRLMSVFLTFFFGWQEKWFFDICNALVFTVFIVLLCVWASCGTICFPVGRYLLFSFLAWVYIPGFHSVYTWMSGAVTYLWPMALVLCFGLPYLREWYDHPVWQDKWVPAVGMAAFGMASGCTNESHIPAVFLVLAAFTYRHYRDGKARAWMVCGLLGLVFGYVVMMLSPSVPVRVAGEMWRVIEVTEALQPSGVGYRGMAESALEGLSAGKPLPWLSQWTLCNNLASILRYLADPFLCLITSCVVAYFLRPRDGFFDKKDKGVVCALLFLIAGTVFPLLFLPYVWARTLFFPAVYIFILCGILLRRANLESPLGEKFCGKAVAFMVVACFIFCGGTLLNAYMNHVMFLEFDTYMRSRAGQDAVYTFRLSGIPFFGRKAWFFSGDKQKCGEGIYAFSHNFFTGSVQAMYRVKDLEMYIELPPQKETGTGQKAPDTACGNK